MGIVAVRLAWDAEGTPAWAVAEGAGSFGPVKDLNPKHAAARRRQPRSQARGSLEGFELQGFWEEFGMARGAFSLIGLMLYTECY
jgi:hypothetical protein